MSLIPIACAAVVLFAGIGNVAGADGPKLLDGPGPYNWECKSDSAFFDEVDGPTTSDHFKVSGLLHVSNMRINRFDQWGAAASVGFNDGRMMQTHAVVFQLFVLRKTQDMIQIVIRGDGGNEAYHTLASQPNTESDIPFVVRLDHGIVSVLAASSALKSPDGHPVKLEATSKKPEAGLKRLFLSCSGAQIKFSNVTVTVDP